KEFSKKIKQIKHIEVIIAIILCVVGVLIYSSLATPKAKTKVTIATNEENMSKELAYALSQIAGVGKTEVLISYHGGKQLKIANKTEKHSDITGEAGAQNEKVVETITPIIINEGGQSKPIILEEIMPKIEGVIVVAQGADDVNVKVNIIIAVATVLNVDNNKIKVFNMK
ncbi:MAG: hypothetical protein RR123_02605, partial [Clostridia bacterium]